MTDTVIEMFDTESDVDDGDDGAARGEAKRLMQHCYQGLQNLLDRYQDSAWVQFLRIPIGVMATAMISFGAIFPNPVSSPVLKLGGAGMLLASEAADPVARKSDVKAILKAIQKRARARDDENLARKKMKVEQNSQNTQTLIKEGNRKCPHCLLELTRQHIQMLVCIMR